MLISNGIVCAPLSILTALHPPPLQLEASDPESVSAAHSTNNFSSTALRSKPFHFWVICMCWFCGSHVKILKFYFCAKVPSQKPCTHHSRKRFCFSALTPNLSSQIETTDSGDVCITNNCLLPLQRGSKLCSSGALGMVRQQQSQSTNRVKHFSLLRKWDHRSVRFICRQRILKRFIRVEKQETIRSSLWKLTWGQDLCPIKISLIISDQRNFYLEHRPTVSEDRSLGSASDTPANQPQNIVRPVFLQAHIQDFGQGVQINTPSKHVLLNDWGEEGA